MADTEKEKKPAKAKKTATKAKKPSLVIVESPAKTKSIGKFLGGVAFMVGPDPGLKIGIQLRAAAHRRTASAAARCGGAR